MMDHKQANDHQAKYSDWAERWKELQAWEKELELMEESLANGTPDPAEFEAFYDECHAYAEAVSEMYQDYQ